MEGNAGQASAVFPTMGCLACENGHGKGEDERVRKDDTAGFAMPAKHRLIFKPDTGHFKAEAA